MKWHWHQMYEREREAAVRHENLKIERQREDTGI